MSLPAELLPNLVSGQQGPIAGDLGNLKVRLAENSADLRAIQKLRYEVFAAENQYPCDLATGLDQDHYDQYCDHLMVCDRSALAGHDNPQIVGTYRLMRQKVADKNCGFYSSNEFDIDPLLKRHPDKNFLELGRSCVRGTHRSKRAIELLWHGTWSYILYHKIDVLFGCASFTGVNPAKFSCALGYLYKYHLAEEGWRAHANRISFHKLGDHACDAHDLKQAMRQLPPLIKGYLRLGAMVGPHAVVDEAFGTTDILIILPVRKINPKYIAYYGANAERHRTV